MPFITPHKVAAAAWFLAALAGPAQAQTTYAAQAGVFSISPCPSFCGGPGAQFGSDSDGGEGASTSFASVSNFDGHGQAQAALTGPALLPILKAEAYADPLRSSRVSADATAMQGFFLGADALGQYDLNVALTGSATGSVDATVVVFQNTDPGFPAVPFTTGASTLLFEVLGGSLQLLDELNLSLPATGSAASDSGQISITGLATGDLIYVWAQVRATGDHGSYGDAFNTLNLNWANAAGLTPTSAVPEPATAASLLAGLGLLAALRRRRR
jgi:PEP-CTERM motif